MKPTNFFRLTSLTRHTALALASTALMLLSSTSANAEPITQDQARQRAAEFLSTRKGSRQLKAVESDFRLSPRRHVRQIRGLKTDALDLYYVFDRGQEEGFVIVSGDDQTFPVLGYTDQGHFDYTQLPENMKFWLESYEDELDAIRRSGAPIRKANIPRHDPVEQLCTSKWNQGSPYNESCPMYFTLGRSVTGCVATAMAQILYYHRAKMVTETQAEIPAFQGRKDYNGQKLQVPAVPNNSPIDWDNMTDTYSSSSTAKQRKAVADLMLYCGASVQMDYSNSSSGAYSSAVDDAFRNYFGFGESVKYSSFNGMTEEQWDAMIYNEVANARPVYLSGANGSGGHAFVCDGYDGNLCYHINWGWGGSSDGFYLLSSLHPGSQGIGGSDGGYSQSRECVIGVEPINFETRALPIANTTLKRLVIAAFDKDGDGKLTYGEAAEVTDLGDTFKGKSITEFTELYNFTGLTEIPDEAFSGCSRLTTIKLPKSVKRIGARAFEGCRTLKEINLRDDITEIGEDAFNGCRVLPNVTLPANLSAIAAGTFEGCATINAVTLPLGIKSIGNRAFANCTKLKSFTVNSINPEQITLGEDVWDGIDLSTATLNSLQGTQEYFANTPQWRDFGSNYRQRILSGGDYIGITTNTNIYLYNVGTGRYLTRGEAWNTQAIVDDTDEPMRFQLRHSASMPEGVYYLYSNDTGNDKHILFRSSTDTKVGRGIKACFVDGQTSVVTDKTAYWEIKLVEGTDNTYTLQIPSDVTGYVEGEYLGVQPSHASNAFVPTYGIYSDISYADYKSNCHWMFTPYDADKLATYQKAKQLENLLNVAKKKKLDCTNEEAVYADLGSSDELIEQASGRLRKKLDLINFVDKAFRNVCVNSIDGDSDGEISYTEAATLGTLEGIFTANTSIVDASDLKYFAKLQYLAGNEFQNCTKLEKVVLPENLTGVYYNAFRGCSKLESIELPLKLKEIGDNAFYGCAKLKEVRVSVADPALISLGQNVFKNVPVSSAVLYVPYGSKDLYAQADVWKEFGEIREMRAMRWPDFAEFEVNKSYYVFNLGMRAYINKGEAYGTQAVVSNEGLIYHFKHVGASTSNTYYMEAENLTGNKLLFRTSTDSKVGSGTKACFVDGPSDRLTDKTAYWSIEEVGEHIYTLQVPSTLSTYVEGEYLGTDIKHATDFTTSTYGLYWDIALNEEAPEATQWGLISIDEVEANREFFNLTEDLKQLIQQAKAQDIDVAAEQAVYDNFEASEAQIQDAIASVRTKLHFVPFIDAKAKSLALNRWDLNDDDELSTEELASVTDLSTVFKGASAIKTLEDLQYFTSITEIPAEAFRSNTAMQAIIIPANVRTIGENAFATTSKLKYIAILNPSSIVDGNASGINNTAKTIFVPAALVDAYKADEFWGKFDIEEYTGVPTVTAQPSSRQYGRANGTFTYAVTGAPVTGEPALTCDAELTSPVGDYPIQVAAGSIVSLGVQYVEGTLTVERAPVTVTALSYTREYGEENPVFEAKYSSLRNREKIDDVLKHEPIFECDATPESYAGVYEICVSGCEADNYEFTYVAGKLTIQGGPDAINGIASDKANAGAVYDLSGRKVNRTQNGIYIRNKKKVAVSKAR